MGGNNSKEQKLCRAIERVDWKNWKLPYEQMVQGVKIDSKELCKISTNKKLWLLLRDVSAELSTDKDDYALLMKGAIILLRTKKFYSAIQTKNLRTLDPIFKGCLSKQAHVAAAALEALENVVQYQVEADGNRNRKAQKKGRSEFFKQGGSKTLIESLKLYGKWAAEKSNSGQFEAKDEKKKNTVTSLTHSVFRAAELCLKVVGLLLCEPKNSTSLKSVIELRKLLQPHGPLILSLLRNASVEVRRQAIKVTCGMILTSSNKEAQAFQGTALTQGIVLWVLYLCVDPTDTNIKHTNFFDKNLLTDLRILFGLLADQNQSISNLMRKILPGSLISQKTYDLRKIYKFDFPAKLLEGISPQSIRWGRYDRGDLQQKATDWDLVMRALNGNAETARLIWNSKFKLTLMDSLLEEIEEFDEQKKVLKNSAWEWDGFEVLYPQLRDEYEVGGFYLRLLLKDLEGKNEVKLNPNSEVVPLMEKLFIKATVELGREERLALVKTMSLIYQQFPDKFANWAQVPYLVSLMQQQHDPVMRDLVVTFLKQVLSTGANVRTFVDSNGIQTLVKNLVAVHASESEKSATTPEKLVAKERKIERKDFFGQVAEELSTKTLSVNQLASEALNLLNRIFDTKPQYLKVIPRRYPILSAHLIQMMFARDSKESVLKRKSQELLYKVIRKNDRLIPTLAKTGIFIFALQGLTTCSEELLDIVYKTHLRQRKGYAPENRSVLSPYLPSPLVVKLALTKTSDQFRRILQETHEDPSCIWGPKQIKELSAALEKFVGPLKNQLKTTPDFCFKYDKKIHAVPVPYPSLQDELCVGNIYLRLLFDKKHKEYKIQAPDFLAQALMESMEPTMKRLQDSKFAPKAVEDCQYILKAQALLSDKYTSKRMMEYRAFGPLLEILAAQQSGAETQDLAGSLVISLLCMKGRRLSHAQRSGIESTNMNVSQCVKAGGTEKLAIHFVNLVEKGDIEEVLLLDSLEALTILARNASNEMCKVALNPDCKFLTSLLKLMNVRKCEDRKLELCLDLTEALLDSHDRGVPQAIVNSGLLLRIIQVAIEGEAGTDLKSVDLIRKTIIARNSSEEDGKARAGARTVVISLLTPGIYMMLKHEEKAVEKVAESLRSEIQTPTIIWTDAIRNELRDFIQKEEKNITSYKKWVLPDAFAYTALKDEPVWDDVYLRLYAKQKLGYKLPPYLDISTGEFFHSLLMVLARFGREKGLLHDVKEPREPGFDSPKSETSKSEAVQIPFPPGTNPLEHLTVLCRCILHILQSDSKLHKQKEQGLFDLFRLIVHPYAPLQNAILQVVGVCKDSIDSMKFVLASSKWIICMLHNSERKGDIPSLKIVLDALHAIINNGVWPENMDNPPPGAKTFKEVETHLLDHGLPVLLSLIICDEEKFAREERVLAAKLCGLLSVESNTDTYRALHCIFTWQVGKFLEDCESKPQKLVDFFDEMKKDPKVYWTKEVRSDVIYGIKSEAKGLLQWQKSALISARKTGEEHAPCKWDAKNVGKRIMHPNLAKQLCVGEIFVYQLINYPHYPVDPEVYLPPLWVELERKNKSLSEGTKKEEKIVGALIESLQIVVKNLPHIAEAFEKEKLLFLYQLLDSKFVSIKKKALELLVACAKETAISAAMGQLIRYCIPLLIQGDTEDIMVESLQLLRELIRRSSPVVEQILNLGAHAILILICFGRFKNCTKKVKNETCHLIGAMCNDATNGTLASDGFCKILTEGFRTKFLQKPEMLLAFFTVDHEAKERKWNGDNRDRVIAVLEKQVPEMVTKMKDWRGERLFNDEEISKVWPKSVEEQTEEKENTENQPAKEEKGNENGSVEKSAEASQIGGSA